MDFNWQRIITAVIIVITIYYLKEKAPYASKNGELKYGLLMKGFGLVTLLFSVVPFVILLIGNYQVDKPGETKALVGITIGFGLGAIYTITEGFFVKGNFDNKSINFTTPWTGAKHEKWEDLQSIKFDRISYWHVLKFNDGKIIRISSYLGGHKYLLDLLRKKGYKF